MEPALRPIVCPLVLKPTPARSLLSALSKTLRDRVEDSISQLRGTVAEFKNVCYANSLGSESIVLTDLIWGSVSQIDIFSIDTGRLYPETYDLIERLQRHYGRALTIYYPKSADVEGWVSDNGINGFRAGLDQRRACCGIRKVEPFRRAVAGRGAWVTGIRRAQSASRALASPVEWDGAIRPAQGESIARMVGKAKSGSTSARSGCRTTPFTTADFRA